MKVTSLTGGGLLLTSCGAPAKQNPLPSSTPSSPAPLGVAQETPAKPRPTSVKPNSDHVELVTKDHPLYESLRQGYNKAIQKHPRVIALCKTPEGISEAVQYARKNQLPVAIKSGGHSFEGFSCNDDGLVINLSQLNKVEWKDSKTVKIGPACTLSQLYDSILPRKRILPTGSCGSVGVGGLTLGGGYGFFSRKYGLTCDNLMEVTLVDGNGESQSSNDDPELLWACRGGGNGNFGVVSEMVFRTHPAPATFQSHRFKVSQLNAERAKNILQHWFELGAKLPESCFSAFVLNGKSLTILVTDFEGRTGEIQDTLDALKNLTDKTTLGEPRELAHALKVYYSTSTPNYFHNASAGLYKSFDDISPCIQEVLEIVVHRPGMIYQINTLGGKMADPALETTASYPHRSYLFVSELQTYWEVPGKETKLLEDAQAIQKLFSQHGIAAHYVNYPSSEFENWAQAYYGDSYPRLQAIKRKYDGDNIFRYEQSVRIA